MHQRKRIYYSETQRSLMWDRWQRDESLQQVTDLFDRHHSAIAGVLVRSGGIRSPPRRRSLRALRPAEREEISRGVAAGKSIRSIAVVLNQAPSTISRELQRNQGRQRYRAVQADQAAWEGIQGAAVATHSISTCAPKASPVTPKVLRAGNRPSKKLRYTALNRSQFDMSESIAVHLTRLLME